ncbi:MAG: hypothetical protein ACRYE7_00195 [Janthinobacterium lividum]
MTSTVNSPLETTTKREVITALTIANAVNIKCIEQLVPNLPKIMNSMKDGVSFKSVVMDEIKLAIMSNLSDFKILNTSVSKSHGTLETHEGLGIEADENPIGLEQQIYKLWTILKTIGIPECDD